MARPANKNSVRQQGFKILDSLTHVKREYAIETLKEMFGIGDSYSATIYASWRTLNKENGNIIKVYTVKDMKDGKPVKPFIRIQNVFNPEPNACLNVDAAKALYKEKLNFKIFQAGQL